MIISKIRELCELALPPFAADRLYMHPIEISNPVLPEEFSRWADVVKQVLLQGPTVEGLAYVTIDQKRLKAGESHRRGGPHTDGNYIYSWGGGGGWLTGTQGRYLPPEKHRMQYCSKTGGMLIVSDFAACKAWRGEFSKEPLQGGNCEHLIDELDKAESFILKPNTLYLANSTCIHESLPVNREVNRTLLRITLPADAGE